MYLVYRLTITGEGWRGEGRVIESPINSVKIEIHFLYFTFNTILTETEPSSCRVDCGFHYYFCKVHHINLHQTICCFHLNIIWSVLVVCFLSYLVNQFSIATQNSDGVSGVMVITYCRKLEQLSMNISIIMNKCVTECHNTAVLDELLSDLL